jgi:hypothetical protein
LAASGPLVTCGVGGEFFRRPPIPVVAPLHPRHPAAGQSSLEYVGLLSVVLAALAVGGPAAGLPGVGVEVARAVRTGACIVGGDVCRRADAVAEGLAPCTLSERVRGTGAALTVVSLRIGERHQLTITRRSDGSVLIARLEGDEAGVSGGVGITAGPLELGADGRLGVTVVAGTGWEFRDAAAAGRFLADLKRDGAWDPERWPPAWRSGDAGLAAAGEAGLGARLGGEDGLDLDVAGVEASAESAIGVRVGPGITTVYLRAESEGPRVEDALGHVVGPSSVGPVLVEYTRNRHGPRELAFRAVGPGGRDGETVETVARLDLRVPRNRAVAARLLRRRAPWPPAVRDDLRAVIRHTAAVGTVERSVYAVEDDSRELALSGRLGVELGIELERATIDRRLVSATAWTAGSRARAREDCLQPTTTA